jgi:hypothetical protein
MKSFRLAVVAAAVLLAGAARAMPTNSGFMNQEEQRAALALVHTTPPYVDLTTTASAPTSGYMSQEERRVAAALLRTTPAYMDLSACPPSHEASHDQIAEQELQVPDRDRGKLVAYANCCSVHATSP